MEDLFNNSVDGPAKIVLPDAELWYFENALRRHEASQYFQEILTQTHWREEEVVVWGKRHKQPRLVAWHGDHGAAYSYSGSVMHPLPWTPLLLTLRERVSQLANATFNSVLLNLYRDERDNMGWHSDDEPELGRQPVIASISLGEIREFQLKHKKRKDLPIARINLGNGSLLLMSGPTQTFWQHCLKRETAKVGKRINLTFRTVNVHSRDRIG